jgi:hypothetical protein
LQRTREELRSWIDGRLSTGSAKDELVKLATRLIVEEALEGESGQMSFVSRTQLCPLFSQFSLTISLVALSL